MIEFIRQLEDMGYKEFPPHKEGVYFAASRRLPVGVPQCDTNEHKISWHLYVWEPVHFGNGNNTEPTITLEIVAEKGDYWFDLSVYGLSLEIEQIKAAEQKLLTAWVAVNI